MNTDNALFVSVRIVRAGLRFAITMKWRRVAEGFFDPGGRR
jgi:hypothetical protein